MPQRRGAGRRAGCGWEETASSARLRSASGWEETSSSARLGWRLGLQFGEAERQERRRGSEVGRSVKSGRSVSASERRSGMSGDAKAGAATHCRCGDAEQVWLRGAAAAQQRKGDARRRRARGGRDRGARKMGGEQVPCASKQTLTKESLGKESSSGGQGEEGVGESGRE
jgi:hypothetical protein